MDTSKMWPETIVSGFLYLASFLFVLIQLMGLPHSTPTDFYRHLFSASTATIGLISALTLGATYFFGHVAGRLMGDLFEGLGKLLPKKMRGEPEAKQDDIDFVKISTPQALFDALQGRWIAKYFYRSTLGGILSLVLASAPWGICSVDPRTSTTAWVLGGGLFIVFSIAFLTQRRSYSSLKRAMAPPT